MAVGAVNHHPEKAEGVFEQYETLEQQQESYIVGMWTFLVTEVMFFAVLFGCYIIYRWKYQPYFYEIHKSLNIVLGGTNTVVLLTSSFFMAMAVRSHMLKENKWKTLKWLAGVQACAFGFLVIKTCEYSAKLGKQFLPMFGEAHYYFPNDMFAWHNDLVPANIAKLFFSMYFGMTGLHGAHVIIGILSIAVLMVLIYKESHLVKNDYIPTELVGLYWHFVDLVWIFLFPLFYLMPK